jgi:hypothetical protein
LFALVLLLHAGVDILIGGVATGIIAYACGRIRAT